MNQLEERLRTAGRSHADATPDIESIKQRGRKIRRNRRIGTALASVALVAVGGVAAVNLVRPSSDSTNISASDGDLTDDGGVGQTSSTEPDELVEEDGTIPSTTLVEEAGEGSETVEAPPGEGATDTDATGDAMGDATPAPGDASLSDGNGGWLTATSAGIEHLQAGGSRTVITFPDPPGGFAQRWPSDVVEIDGRHYLLVDQFVNRQDLADERIRALAEKYGIAYDPDDEASLALFDAATPEESASTEHWEVGILAVDLTTGEPLVVENRVINSAMSPDWVYNGHITARDDVILVMRELWQSTCMYVEAMTLAGQPVAVAESEVYAKPVGVEDLTYEDISAIFNVEREPPQPCYTLSDVADGGLAFLGTQADPERLTAFRQAFFELGLG